MSTLLLKFKAPLQSWGSESRFRVRHTGRLPTKSGVIGLCASALGRSREESVEDLVTLRFGVRIDQPGTVIRDFQTARAEGDKNATIINRYFLQDACFVVGLEGEKQVIDELHNALRSPERPLFLGRRSCPINTDFLLKIHDCDVEEALRLEEWHASPWYRKQQPTQLSLQLFRDAKSGEIADCIRDVPVSFSQEERIYSWRTVTECPSVQVANEDGVKDDYWTTVIRL